MTVPALLALQVAVDEQKARGEKPTIAGAVEIAKGICVAPLDACLRAESDRYGHVEFTGGVPRWVAGPARFAP